MLALTAPGRDVVHPLRRGGNRLVYPRSCQFVKDSYVGDTLYPALEIAELSKEGGKGVVTMTIIIFNHRGETVLTGHQKFLLKLA